MPNCFSLTKKGEERPAYLPDVDDEMRKHFGAPADDTNWFRCWYDIIGLGLAMGHSTQRMREILIGVDALLEILDWIEENYTSEAWCERG